MDYQGLYEDLLRMEDRADEAGHTWFARECFAFRRELLLRYYNPVGRIYV